MPCNLHTTTASQAASFDSTSKSLVPDPCRHPQQLSAPLLGPLAKVPPCRHFCSAPQRAIPVWVLRPCVLQQWRAVRRPRETKHSRFLRDPWPGRWLWCREGNRTTASRPTGLGRFHEQGLAQASRTSMCDGGINSRLRSAAGPRCRRIGQLISTECQYVAMTRLISHVIVSHVIASPCQSSLPAMDNKRMSLYVIIALH